MVLVVRPPACSPSILRREWKRALAQGDRLILAFPFLKLPGIKTRDGGFRGACSPIELLTTSCPAREAAPPTSSRLAARPAVVCYDIIAPASFSTLIVSRLKGLVSKTIDGFGSAPCLLPVFFASRLARVLFSLAASRTLLALHLSLSLASSALPSVDGMDPRRNGEKPTVQYSVIRLRSDGLSDWMRALRDPIPLASRIFCAGVLTYKAGSYRRGRG